MHNLSNQVADLHSKADAFEAANATLIKARADFGREQQLYQQQVISKSEFDAFQEAFSVAQAQQQRLSMISDRFVPNSGYRQRLRTVMS